MAINLVTLFHNAGSSHPVVARLMLGPSHLMGPFGIDEAMTNAVSASLTTAAESLIACYDLRTRLMAAIEERFCL